MTHTLMWMDGLEHEYVHGNLLRWSGTRAVETERTSYSNSAMRVNVSNQSGFVYCYNYIASSGWWTSGGTYYKRATFHMWIDTMPGNGQYFYMFYTKSNVERNWLRLVGQSDGTGKFNNRSGGTSTGHVTTGKWYTVSFKFDYPSSNVTVRERDTDTEVVNLTWSSDNGIGNEVRLFAYSNSYGNIVFDNIVYESATSAGNIADPYDLLGNQYAILPVRPESNGTLAQFSGGRNYLDLDEQVLDGDTTRDDDYGGDSTTKTNQYGPGTLANYFPPKISIESIHNVSVCTWWRNPSTTNSYNGYVGIISGGTSYMTGAGDITRFGATYGGQYKQWPTNDPYDSNPWTESKVNALGMEIRRSRTFTVKWAYNTKVQIDVLAKIIVEPDFTPRIGMVFSKVQDFYEDLRAGAIPRNLLEKRHDEVKMYI